MIQKDQLIGMTDRALAIFLTVFLGWLVKRGYLGESEAAALLPAVVLLPSLAWGWYTNRDIALLKSASNVPGTTVVTTEEMANSTPEKNIVASKAPQPKEAVEEAKIDKAIESIKKPVEITS